MMERPLNWVIDYEAWKAYALDLEARLKEAEAMCEEEIAWAEACIKEMAEKGNYCSDDRVWLPCHLKAYQTIGKALKGLGKEKTNDQN